MEGLREFSVNVWNSNTLTYDDFIGSGKIQLQRVLSSGYDHNAWALQDKRGRHAGEVRLILHYANAYVSQEPSFTRHLKSLHILQQVSQLHLLLWHTLLIQRYIPHLLLLLCHTLLIQQYIPHFLLLLSHTLLFQQYIPHPHIINHLHILQLIHQGHLL